MATVRLENGSDITVKLEVAETLAAIKGASGKDFLELPGEEAPIYVRPGSIIAVLEDAQHGRAGFRISAS